MNADENARPELEIRRINLDTEKTLRVKSRHSRALRPEVFRGLSRDDRNGSGLGEICCLRRSDRVTEGVVDLGGRHVQRNSGLHEHR